MNFLKAMPHWGVMCICLAGLGTLLMLFTIDGYIGAALVFGAALLTVTKLAPTWLKTAVWVLTLAGFAYFVYIEIPIIKNARTDADAERKYVIVLGAAVDGDVPSLSLRHRLESTQEYLLAYPEAKAVLSGGRGKGENISEAECMFRWLTERGIEAERLIMEAGSTSTAENLKNSFTLIRERGDEPDGNVALLSSSYHLYRAKTMAKMQGVEAAGVAGNPGYPDYMLNCFIREAFGVTHLLVFGV